MVMTSRMRESNLGEGEGTSQPSNGPAYAGVKPYTLSFDFFLGE